MADDDDDVGLPEEAAGKLDQENTVEADPRAPWRNSLGQLCFQNVDDLYEFGSEIFISQGQSVLVIVIDNEGEDVLHPNNKNYWVVKHVSFGAGNRNNTADIMPLLDYYDELRADFGSRWASTANEFTQQPNGAIRLPRHQGLRVYVPDPARDDNRPDTQVEATTSTTTGTTVVTTTTAKVGAAGVVTESETIPAEVGLDAFGGAGTVSNPDASDPRGRNQRNTPTVGAANPLDAFGGAGPTVGAADPLDAFGGAGPTVGAAADAAATGAQTGTEPCLPNNPPVTNAGGSGATPPASVPYQDAIMRQARAAAAAPSSVIPNPDANDPRGRNQQNTPPAQTSSPSGAAANALDAFGGAGPAVATTAPTTVTQQPSTPTAGQSTTPTNSSANVYIYEPLEGGFDRYDFNSGKKVFTPNGGGSSMNAAGNASVPTTTPRVTTPPLDGGIPVGSTTVASGSRLRQRKEAEAAGRQVGPQ
jgi:hypothetical protein